MRLTKYVDSSKGVDRYVITVGHQEAENAFEKMSYAEKEMIAQMQDDKDILVVLRVLLFWAQKIEESKW